MKKINVFVVVLYKSKLKTGFAISSYFNGGIRCLSRFIKIYPLWYTNIFGNIRIFGNAKLLTCRLNAHTQWQSKPYLAGECMIISCAIDIFQKGLLQQSSCIQKNNGVCYCCQVFPRKTFADHWAHCLAKIHSSEGVISKMGRYSFCVFK